MQTLVDLSALLSNYPLLLQKITTTIIQQMLNWNCIQKSWFMVQTDLRSAPSMRWQTRRLAIGTFGLNVGYAITLGFSTSVAGTDGTVGIETGYIKGVITNIGPSYVDVKLTDKYSITNDKWSKLDYEEGSSTNPSLGYDEGLFDNTGGHTGGTPGNHPNRYRIYDTAGS